MKVVFIMTYVTLICFASNIFWETIQLSVDNGYGYKGILELLELNKNLTSTNINACNTYISNINYKLDFSYITTIFDIVIDIILVPHIFWRLVGYESCRIGALLTLFLIFGEISAFILTCISSDNYFKTKYTSNDFESCNKMNGKFQISESEFLEKSYTIWYFGRVLFCSIAFIFFLILITNIFDDCNDKYCVNKENLWFCECIQDIFKGIMEYCKCSWDCIDCCECCNECGKCFQDCCKCHDENGKCCCDCFENCKHCDGCGTCCCDCFESCECCDGCGTCCCEDDYSKLKQKIRKYKRRIKDLEDENENIRNENENIRNENENLRNENNDLRNENNDLRNENENLRNENENLRNENNDLKKNNHKLETENNKLKKQVEELQKVLNKLQNQLLILEEKIKKLNIEKKQYDVIQYYIKRKNDKYNDYSPKSAFLKKIYKNLGLKLTHQKFQEIALY